MNLKITFLSFLLLCFNLKLIAQLPSPDLASEPSIQSPNASAMGRFGEIPVSLFTGTPLINIPITTIKAGDIAVPISLLYDTQGCRPDQHPTWVGLNWSLQAGGVIRRHTNGRFDENVNSRVVNTKNYYDNHTDLAANDWDNLVHSLKSWEDLSPDEFSFSFNGISGSFILNHEGKWVVKSKGNLSLKVQHEIHEDYDAPLILQPIPRTFTKFILTTGDGTRYIFGGQPNAIEFSVPGLPQHVEPKNLPPGFSGPPIVNNALWIEHVQSSAWHLSEIISPYGQSIKFYYTVDFSFKQVTYTEISKGLQGGQWHYTNDTNDTKKYAVVSPYLDRIETSTGIVCTFIKSPSNELALQFKQNLATLDFIPIGFGIFWQFYKLDLLKLEANDKLVKKVSFQYIENPSERLKLKKVNFLSKTSSKKIQYGIEYNDQLLPAYNSGQEDHWGFYNGKNYFGSYKPNQSAPEAPNLVDYYSSREPNADLLDAEIIKRITYPSGGYTEFFFEPHEYSSQVIHSPTISLESLTANKMAGGLRIRKIKTYESAFATPLIKEFFYVKDYINGGTVSSGVLAGKPVYYQEGPCEGDECSKFSSLPLNYLNTTNGNHITYSQVTEKSKEGYILYSYTNQDNGYLDKEAFAQATSYTNSSKYYNKLFGKLEIERGLLLNTQYYSRDKFLLKETINTYNQNPNRYNNYVRAVQNVHDPYIPAQNFVAFPIYTFYPYLEKQVNIKYFRNGEEMKTIMNFTYDDNYRVLRAKHTVNSQGNQIKTEYKYPFDYAYIENRGAPSDNMVDRNMINLPIEKKEIINIDGTEKVLSAALTEYKMDESLIVPSKLLSFSSKTGVTDFTDSQVLTSGKLSCDNRYKTKTTFIDYDKKGNLLSSIPNNGINTSYIWGYGNTHLIAKATNATYDEVKTVISPTTLNNLHMSYNEVEIRSAINQLREGLPNANVYTYTYDPLIGRTSETDPNNITTYYEYNDFSKLNLIKNDKKYIIKKIEHNYTLYGRMSIIPSDLNFGTVGTETSKSKSIKVYNSGNTPFTISHLETPLGFVYSPDDITSVNPGQFINITLTFNPTSLKSYTGLVKIVSDAKGRNTFSISGTGTEPKVISVSGNLDFGYVYSPNINFPTTSRTMKITNSGTAPLSITTINVPHGFSVNWSNDIIQAGQSKNVTVTFSPIGPGGYSGTIEIISNKTSGVNIIEVSGHAIIN